MSLTVQHALSTRSTAIAEVDAGRDRRSPPARVDDAGDRAAPNSRHALLTAIADAVEALLPGSADTAAGDEPVDGDASKQALHGFVHALLVELRPSAGEGGHGRGFAWGRTTAATLGQRLDDLVARLQADGTTTSSPATGAADSTVATPASATAAIDAAAATATTEGTAASTPAATSGQTSNTTAPAAPSPLPTSSLLTAFRELATARGAGGVDGATSDALIAMLKRVASALDGDVGALAPAAGGLLDATA
jgi:hypothetical protein